MARLQLFEWEDQAWLPSVFRDFITDHLRYTHQETERHPVNREIARRLKGLVLATGIREIVDLCTGAGGPMPAIAQHMAVDLECPVRVTLTDLFPNVETLKALEVNSSGRLVACLEPVSALAVPESLHGIRTLCTALHHFDPAGARAILADAAREGTPIAVFEPLERSVRMGALLALGSFVRGLTHTPRVGRLTVARFLVTYVLPIAPVLFAWDGAVSVARSYTVGELRQFCDELSLPAYEWAVGRFEIASRYGPLPVTYVMGRPTQVATTLRPEAE